MAGEKRYSELEAQRHFAAKFNGASWDLLDKADRTKEEDDLMVLSACASLRHWLDAGSKVHHQRGEWLIARVYSALGVAERALYHANRCLELTEQYAGDMEDFDRAYAYEAVARAHAIAGNRDQAIAYIELAAKAGEAIADEKSREFFAGDFDGGDWAGVR